MERPRAIINAMCEGYKKQTEEAVKSGRFKLIEKETQYMFSHMPSVYFVTGAEFKEVPDMCTLPVYRWAYTEEPTGLYLDTPVMKVSDLIEAKKVLVELDKKKKEVRQCELDAVKWGGEIGRRRVELKDLEDAIQKAKIKACNLGLI